MQPERLMTSLRFAPPDADGPPIPLHLVAAEGVEDWAARLDPGARAWVAAMGFDGKTGSVLAIPDGDGGIGMAVAGLGTATSRRRGRFALAAARARLPGGIYALAGDFDGVDLDEAALGWLLAGYRFARYAKASPPAAELVAPDGVDAPRLEAIAAGEALTRDLINTPSSDMGPAELEQAVRDLAGEHGARVEVTEGEALLEANLPLIHAVGRASPRAPRLIDLRWGESGPRVTLVGKGVCFDTGGLNLKPGASMALMKKDMGGAATVLGLARMIMALGLEVRLRVLVPAVENAVSGAAFRPGDILTSRKGLTVEINNTDAEGRLVLADALALAVEEETDLLVSMATLTGAARVAVGPDLAPFYCDEDGTAEALMAAGQRGARPAVADAVLGPL